MSGAFPPQRLLSEDSSGAERRWLIPVTIIAGSLATVLPVIAQAPLLPPIGLLLLLAWRLRRPDRLRPYAALPYGLVDDLVSGQPLGSAMALWTVCTLAIDVLDTRLVARDFWQDWLIAAAGTGLCLAAGRLIAAPLGAHVDGALLLQIAAAAALYPAVARFVTWIDTRWGMA